MKRIKLQNKWHSHFFNLCLEISTMSKDPSTKVGAIIIGKDNEIVSTGYNGFPRGISDTPDRLNNRDTKMQLVVHAEMNAILNAVRIGTSTLGCIMYVCAVTDGEIWGGPPCARCAVHIIQAGIREIIVPAPVSIPERWKENLKISKNLLLESGIQYREII